METKLIKEEQNEIKQGRERGASMVEYGILVALIAGIAVIAVGPLGQRVAGAFTAVTQQIPN